MIFRICICWCLFIPLGLITAQTTEDSLLIREKLDKLDLWLEEYQMDSLQSNLESIEYLVQNHYPSPSLPLIDLQTIKLQYHHILGEYNLSRDYGHKALQQSIELDDTMAQVKSYNHLAKSVYYQQEFAMTDSLCGLALNLYKTKLGREDEQVAALYNLRGLSHFRRWHTDEAIEFFEKALKINRRELGDFHPNVAKNYGNLAIAYQDKGDYLRAIEYTQSTAEIFRKGYGTDYQPLATAYYNLAMNYDNIGEKDTSIAYYWKAMEIRKKAVPDDHIYIAEYWEGIASSYTDLQKFDTALWYYEKAKAIFDKKDLKHYDATGFLGKLGYVHYMMGNWEEAILYYQKALNLRLEGYGERDARVMSYRMMLGSVESSRKHFAKGQTWFDKALEPFGSALQKESYAAFPSMRDLLLTVRSKAWGHYQWYLQDGDTDHLDSAFVYSQRAMHLLDFLKSGYREDESRIILSEAYTNVIEQSLEIIFELYKVSDDEKYLPHFFTALERKKATSLLVQLQERKYDQFVNIPQDISQQEVQLRNTVLELEEKQRGLITMEADSTLIQVQYDLRDAKRNYDDFIQSLSSIVPEYFNLKYQLHYPEIAEIQDILVPGELMVSYHLSGGKLYLFYCSQDREGIIKKDLDWSVQEEIAALRDTFFNPELIKVARQKDLRFKEIVNRLSYTLIDPLPIHVWEIDRICIIPDGVLGLIPFDCLLSERIDPNTPMSSMPFLCLDYDLYTSYSVSVLLSHRRKETEHSSLLAFAPSYEGYDRNTTGDGLVDILIRSGHLPLPGAEKEATTIAQIWNGKLWTGKQANESAFKQHMHDGGILHLSMHAVVDQEQPMQSTLLFAKEEGSDDDGYLYASELYGMNLGADMVVLSACNTGFGKMAQGEGTQSLSRAFAYAGVPSTVMSLWKIPDATSGRLMIHFYENLKTGQSKPQALAEAKRSYLSEVVSDELAHPYYWAGLVLSGDPAALLLQRGDFSLLWLSGILLTIVSILVLTRRQYLRSI